MLGTIRNEFIMDSKHIYLEQNVFKGLKNLNDGFDTKTIKYFSETDFRVVLERVEKLKITIHGIEPWKDGQFYDVLTSEDFNLKENKGEWYWEAFNKFIGMKIELQYAASYEVSEELLDNDKSA